MAGAQRGLLLRLLHAQACSEIGQRYGFASIRTVAEYQARLPCTDYEAYEAAIQRIARGEAGVLTAEPVRLLEPTSGSSAATKLIPYTARLQAEFQRAIAPWIVDLFRHDPALLHGPAYWSLTPVAQQARYSEGGLPIGFEEDSEYLGRWQGALIRALLALPPALRHVAEMDNFRYLTLLFLLRAPALTLISIWNPTFLTLLLERLPAWGPSLAEDISRGTLSLPVRGALPPGLAALNRPWPGRGAAIRAILEESREPATCHARLWPRLRLLSCWADGYAAPAARTLASLFPHATLQGKGLIATEGIVSIPLHGQPGAALALRAHFFEFQPADDPAATPRLAHELAPGARYTVLLTTGGGLYRYRLHDLVEVVGHRDECPLLRFIGKAAHIADHFGEKLNALHVERALAAHLERLGLQPTFAMVACEHLPEGAAYLLFIEQPEVADERLAPLGSALEAALCENFHYRYCRALGQLGPLRLFRVQGGQASYLARCQALGQRAGDIKPLVLHQRDGWLAAFTGHWVEGW